MLILAKAGTYYVLKAPLDVAEEISHLQASGAASFSLALRPDIDTRQVDASALGTTTNRVIIRYGLRSRSRSRRCPARCRRRGRRQLHSDACQPGSSPDASASPRPACPRARRRPGRDQRFHLAPLTGAPPGRPDHFGPGGRLIPGRGAGSGAARGSAPRSQPDGARTPARRSRRARPSERSGTSATIPARTAPFGPILGLPRRLVVDRSAGRAPRPQRARPHTLASRRLRARHRKSPTKLQTTAG